MILVRYGLTWADSAVEEPRVCFLGLFLPRELEKAPCPFLRRHFDLGKCRSALACASAGNARAGIGGIG